MVGHTDSAIDSNAIATGLQNLVQAGIPIFEAISQLIEKNNNNTEETNGDNTEENGFDCAQLDSDFQVIYDAYYTLIAETDLKNCDLAIANRKALEYYITELNILIQNGQGNCDISQLETLLGNLQIDLDLLNVNCPIIE